MPAYSPTASKLARYLGGAIAALFIAPATWAQDASAQHAESFPTRAIEVVLPAPPGGTLDAAIRILAEQAHDVFGQRVVPMNRTGAGGNIAGEAVARAQPDGYTLLLGTDAIHSANAHLYSRMGFDGVKDFAPVMLVGSFPIIMTVRDDFPAQNLEEFIAYVRANPGKVTYGSPGLGTTQHLMAETLLRRADLDMTHIPYKGADGVTQDLVGGRIDVGFFSLASAQKVAEMGKGRHLASAEPERFAALPDLPTLSETLPGAVVQTWFGLSVPQGTEPARIQKLEEGFQQVLADAETRAKLESAGIIVINGGQQDLAQVIARDFASRGELLQSLNIKLD